MYVLLMLPSRICKYLLRLALEGLKTITNEGYCNHRIYMWCSGIIYWLYSVWFICLFTFSLLFSFTLPQFTSIYTVNLYINTHPHTQTDTGWCILYTHIYTHTHTNSRTHAHAYKRLFYVYHLNVWQTDT